MNTARSPIASRPLIIFVGLLLSLACGLPLSSPPPVTEQPTEPALVVDEPAAVPSEAPSSPPVDIHVITPGDLPIDYVGQAGDQNSSRTASRKQAPGGDQFSTGLFERPFNAQTMDVYYPDLDIVDFSAYQDDTWLYVTIRLQGLGSSGLLSGRYGFELDLDTDGQGEFLVLAFTPVSTDWTTDGVQIWQDANGNIGNA